MNFFKININIILAIVFTLSLGGVFTSCSEDYNFGGADIVPIPSAAFIDADYFAYQGDSIAFNIKLTGQSPWIVNIKNNSSNTDYKIVVDKLFESKSKVYVEESGEYVISSIVDANGISGSIVEGHDKANVTIGIPTASFMGGSQQGYYTDNASSLVVSLLGNAPFTLEYTDGSETFVVDNIMTDTYIIETNSEENTTYTITSFTDAKGFGTISDENKSVLVDVNLYLDETLDCTGHLTLDYGRLDLKSGKANGWCDMYKVIDENGDAQSGDTPSRYLGNNVQIGEGLLFSGYATSGVGNSVIVKNYTGQKGLFARALDKKVTSMTVTDNVGVTYYSAMVRVNSFTDGQNETLVVGSGFNDESTGNSKWPMRAVLVGNDGDGNTQTFSLSAKKDGGTEVTIVNGLTVGETFVIVFRNENRADGTVKLSAMVIRQGEQIPAAEPDDSQWAIDESGSNIVVFGFGLNIPQVGREFNVNVAGIRAANSWESALLK